MDLEQDYMEYVAELSLSVLAVSAAYLVNLSNPVTLLSLVAVPVLFGYTAYISRDGFRRSSLLSLLVLFFLIVNPLFAAVAIVTASGNVLVSVFSSGSSFKDFYGATALPLLLTGLILGLAAYGAATTQPEIRDTVRMEGSQLLGQQAEVAVEESNIIEAQKQAQISLIESTSRKTIRATRGYVLNQTAESMDRQDTLALNEAFRNAQEDIPRRMSEGAGSQIKNSTLDVSSRTKDLASSLLKGEAFLILIPVVTFGLYALQPAVGLLTALAAMLFHYFAASAADSRS